MISSASTLLLATLVFNAAAVLGAPVRIPDTRSEAVVHDVSTPVHKSIVDVPDNRPRGRSAVSRRSARLAIQRDDSLVVARSPVTAPAPVEAKREEQKRSYPRRFLHDYLEGREPATTVKEMVVTMKNTVFDKPSDAVAYASVLAANPIPSAVAIQLGGAGTGTTITYSRTTTLAVPGSSGTPSTTASGSASAGSATPTPTSSADGDGDEPTPTAAATDSSASASATDSSASAAAATPAPTGAAGDDTTASDDKPATADATASDDKPAAADATASDDKPAAADATASADKPDATPASGDASASTDGDAAKSDVTVIGFTAAGTTTPTDPPAGATKNTADTKDADTKDATDTTDTKDTTETKETTDTKDTTDADTKTDDSNATEERRSIKGNGTAQPVMRRHPAYSGASWASSIRRQLTSSH